MKNVTLSFENVVRKDIPSDLFAGKVHFAVVDDSNEVLAEVKGNEVSLKDLIEDYYFNLILKPELEYVYCDILSKQDKVLVKAMSVNDYVEFVNNKYNIDGDELSTFNALYEIYKNLLDYLAKNTDSNNYCFALNSICANYDGTGAGTLLINYLKEHYNLIYLYSIMDIEGYFLDKVNFAEIINGHMYWTNEEKLKEIL